MKKVSLLFALVLVAASPSASAADNVKYSNQKAGQFCKRLDIGKYVATPAGKLKCLESAGATRARWMHS